MTFATDLSPMDFVKRWFGVRVLGFRVQGVQTTGFALEVAGLGPASGPTL